MSLTIKILLGALALAFVIFVLIPLLPAVLWTIPVRAIVLIGVIIAAIIWVLSLGGIALL